MPLSPGVLLKGNQYTYLPFKQRSWWTTADMSDFSFWQLTFFQGEKAEIDSYDSTERGDKDELAALLRGYIDWSQNWNCHNHVLAITRVVLPEMNFELQKWPLFCWLTNGVLVLVQWDRMPPPPWILS